MNLKLFNAFNDKSQLLYYKTILLDFRHQCNNSKILNKTQKNKLDMYVIRAINYCNTNKFIRYSRQKWKLDKRILATSKQLQIYDKIFIFISQLIKDVHSDPMLSTKCKKNLLTYLGCVHSHIRGKLNRKL